MVRALVTGASGFVGRAVCEALRADGHFVRAAVRRVGSARPGTFNEEVLIGELEATTDLGSALDGIEVVVHCAARVHIMREQSRDPEADFMRANRDGTRRLAEAAVAADVRRFVFVSTIGVHGDGTDQTSAGYDESDTPRPHSPYSRSKWQAELALQSIRETSGLEIVIVRPPLVFGPGAPGNFLRLLAWMDRGIPLPLANTANQRSMIYVANLAAFIVVCASHPAAAGEMFVISDPGSISTTELIRKLARAMSRRAYLFPVHRGLTGKLARLLGRGRVIDQLFGSLVVNASKATQRLGWHAPVSLDQALRDTAAWYRTREH